MPITYSPEDTQHITHIIDRLSAYLKMNQSHGAIAKLAQAIHCDLSAPGKWRDHKRRPSLELALKLEKYLDEVFPNAENVAGDSVFNKTIPNKTSSAHNPSQMTTDQVSERLSLPSNYIIEHSRQIPGARLQDGKWRFNWEGVLEWVTDLNPSTTAMQRMIRQREILKCKTCSRYVVATRGTQCDRCLNRQKLGVDLSALPPKPIGKTQVVEQAFPSNDPQGDTSPIATSKPVVSKSSNSSSDNSSRGLDTIMDGLRLGLMEMQEDLLKTLVSQQSPQSPSGEQKTSEIESQINDALKRLETTSGDLERLEGRFRQLVQRVEQAEAAANHAYTSLQSLISLPSRSERMENDIEKLLAFCRHMAKDLNVTADF